MIMSKEHKEAREWEYQKGLLDGQITERNRTAWKIQKIIKWLQGSVWCNAHDTAWIEQTIEKLGELNKESQSKHKTNLQ